jgi:putative membrane protein
LKHIKDFVSGIVIGIANLIPGVSGGTMMVMLGVYDPILLALDRKEIRTRFPFLIVLAAGALVGILLFSRGITFLLSNYPLPLYYAFIGLILGSIPAIYRRARTKTLRLTNIAIFVLAAGCMIVIDGLSDSQVTFGAGAAFSGYRLPFLAWLVVISAISAIAMILPGISGSLVLLLLGGYELVMQAISAFDLSILIPVLFGILLGLFIGLRSVKSMLFHYPNALYSGILGLIAGSVYAIWPGLPTDASGSVDIIGVVSIFLFIASAAAAWRFSK